MFGSRPSTRRLGRIAALLALLAVKSALGATVVVGAGQLVEGTGKIVDEPRVLAAFTRVIVNGPMDVQLKRTGLEKAVVHADDNITPLIETRVDGGRLYVETKKGASFKTRAKIVVAVEFKQLDALQLNGSGDVTADDVRAAIFEGAVHGSGNLRVAKLDADTVAVSIAGSGDFNARGRAEKAGFVIEGSGDVHAEDLQAKAVAVRIAGSGDATVCASESLQVRIDGSGDVRYCGSPRVEKKVAGSGTVKPIR